jgi:ABC-type phosphate transport system substrate-binding protein
MTYWAEAFQKENPNVKVQTKGEGSATVPPALFNR